MRQAIVCTVCHTHLPTESEVMMFLRIAEIMHKQHGVWTYIILPHKKVQGVDKMPSVPGVYYVWSGEWKRYHEACGVLPPDISELLSTGHPKLFTNTVTCVRTGAGGYLQRMLWRGKDQYIPVILEESMAADYSSPMLTSLDDIDLAARSFSYYACQPGFETDMELRVAMRAARRYLNASACKEIEQKAWVRPSGISFDILEKVRRKRSTQRKNAKFTLFFGGRLNEMKRWQMLMKIYDKFYSSGRPIRIVVTTPTTKGMKELPSEVEVFENLGREDFLEKCYRSHVYLSTSKIEGFSIGFIEQLATGIVTVLPNAEWAKALLKSKWSEYPFKYSSIDEAYGWLRWIYENYEEARKRSAWVKDWVKEEYNEEKCVKVMGDQVVGLAKSMWPPPKLGKPDKPNGNARMVLDHIQKMPKRFYLNDLMSSIVENDDNQYRFSDFRLGSLGKFTGHELYVYVSMLPNLKDIGGMHPEFEKI